MSSYDTSKLVRRSVHQKKEDSDTEDSAEDHEERVDSTSNEKSSPPSRDLYPTLEKPDSLSESKTNGHHIFCWYYLTFLLLILLLLSLLLFYLIYDQMFSFDASSDTGVKLQEIKNFLKGVFPDNCTTSKKIIQSALSKIIMQDVEPLAPAILLLISSRGSEKIAQKFSFCLANVIDHKPLQLHSREVNGYSANRFAEEIENFLRSSKQPKVVLIHDLHKISHKVARALHPYCDDQNAVFKRAVFVMTITSNDTIMNNADNKKMDGHASTVLNKVWENWDQNERAPLLTRITVSVAFVPLDMRLSDCKS